MSQDNQWHLSKSVPISLIFTMFIQMIASIWFVATLKNDVDSNRENIVRLETRTERVESIVQKQEITLGRIDENIKSIREVLERMAAR